MLLTSFQNSIKSETISDVSDLLYFLVSGTRELFLANEIIVPSSLAFTSIINELIIVGTAFLLVKLLRHQFWLGKPVSEKEALELPE